MRPPSCTSISLLAFPSSWSSLSFFFSSRRRHTRSLRDWSSDVCSSDLKGTADQRAVAVAFRDLCRARGCDRSEERRVGKSVDLGGRRIIKKKKEGCKRVGQQRSGGSASQ